MRELESELADESRYVEEARPAAAKEREGPIHDLALRNKCKKIILHTLLHRHSSLKCNGQRPQQNLPTYAKASMLVVHDTPGEIPASYDESMN